MFTPREFLTDTDLDADVIDENIQDANLDEMEVTLDEGGDTGEFEERSLLRFCAK
jgi:hypothetical protein